MFRPAAAVGSIGMTRPGPGAALLAAAGAGVLAAVACVAAGALLYSWRAPPVRSPAGSAFAASVLGGALYWLLARTTARPRAWLWTATLCLARGMSLVEVFLPGAPQPLPSGLRPFTGLIEPAEQLLRALGGSHGTPAPPIRGRFLCTSIVMHYVVAVSASVLIPRLGAARAGGPLAGVHARCEG